MIHLRIQVALEAVVLHVRLVSQRRPFSSFNWPSRNELLLPALRAAALLGFYGRGDEARPRVRLHA